MKSSFTDFLVCGGVLSLIVVLAWLIVGVGISPYSQAFFGDYYVIVNVLLFMLAYGIISGLVLQLMLKIKPLPCGEFSMDSPVFTYWKLLSVVFLLAQEVMIPFTSIFTKPLVWRLFGAKVGSESTHDPVESPCRGSAVPDRTGQRTRACGCRKNQPCVPGFDEFSDG